MKHTTSLMPFALSFLLIGFGLISCEMDTNQSLSGDIATSATKSTVDKKTQEVEGIILETDEISGKNGGLFVFIQDANEDNYAIDFLKEDNPMNFAALPQNLEGVKVKATYKIKVEPVVVEIVPVDVKSGFVGGLFEKMTTYTLKATQLKVEEDDEGLKVTIQLGSGKERTYRTDLEAYSGNDPSDYNGKPVNLTYIDDERLLMQNLEVLK